MMFCAEEILPVTMCTFTSSLTPVMPTGSLIPSWSSTMNSWGITWISSLSAGMATAFAASTARSISSCFTSLSLMATTPLLLKLLMCAPPIPARHESILIPAMSSASSTAFLMEVTVLSILTTTPFLKPVEGCEPIPTMLTFPSWTLPTTTHIFVVPISSPTSSSSSFTILPLPFLDYGAFFKPRINTFYDKPSLVCVFQNSHCSL